MNALKFVGPVVAALVNAKAKTVTRYLSDKLVVRATRRTYKGKIVPGIIEVVLMICKPNYRERDFIRNCKKAGVPFPVRKIQLKFPVKKHGRR